MTESVTLSDNQTDLKSEEGRRDLTQSLVATCRYRPLVTAVAQFVHNGIRGDLRTTLVCLRGNHDLLSTSSRYGDFPSLEVIDEVIAALA